jgi:hypothetical protein
MSLGDLYSAPYSERGADFAVQAVTHWLRIAPARVMMGLKAGGLPVTLPDRPAGVSHRGAEAKTDGYITACDDVSSQWLLENPAVLDRYVANIRDVLMNPRVKMDGFATHSVFVGSVELFLGREMDRVDFELDEDDGSFERVIELLRHAPRDGRTAFAMPPEPGMGSFEDPVFLAGDQAWIDGSHLLVEFPPEEGGRVETVAVDRDALADAVEKAWGAMLLASEAIRTSLAQLF